MASQQTPLALLLASLVLLCACDEAAQINSQRVPKDQSGIEDFRGTESPRRTPPNAPAAAASTNFEAPAGWTRGKSSPMFPSDKFLKSFGEHEATLSIMPLPASNGWLANVTRWAGQLQLKKSAEDIENMTETVKVDGISAQRIYLVGDEEGGDAIIGIMAPKGPQAWFIKLMGHSSAVSEAESEFDDYVKSLKIP